MNWNSHQFEMLDWAIIVIGVALVAWFVCRAIRRSKAAKVGGETSDDYFLSGRNETWFTIGAAILRPTLVRNILWGWQVQELKRVWVWLIGKCKAG